MSDQCGAYYEICTWYLEHNVTVYRELHTLATVLVKLNLYKSYLGLR